MHVTMNMCLLFIHIYVYAGLTDYIEIFLMKKQYHIFDMSQYMNSAIPDTNTWSCIQETVISLFASMFYGLNYETHTYSWA